MRRIIILMLLVLALVAPAAAWQEDFQTGSAPGWTTTLVTGTCSVAQYPHSDTYALRLTKTGDNPYYPTYSMIYINPQTPFNYFAFTSISSGGAAPSDALQKIILYNSAGSAIGTSPELRSYLTTTSKRIEIVRDGSTAYIWIDGTLITSFSVSAQPYNVAFQYGAVYNREGANYWYIDDVVIGTAEPDLIALPPEGYFVMEHPTNPGLNGLYDGSGMLISSTNMTISYGVKTDAWGANYPAEGVYQIRIKNVGSIPPAKVINLNMSTPQGRVRLYLPEIFFDNEDARYGWYTAQLYRDEVLLAQQWFGYYNGGGSIAFGEDAYVSSQTATVSHSISHFTLGEFEYRGQVIDLQGTEKESWAITSASGSHSIDLTDYTTGTYVVLLQATDRDTGDEYVFTADTATVNREVWVNGTAYDAETGAPLPNTTVTIQQLETTATNVTIADGSYAPVTGLYTDNTISVNASAVNYTHTNFSFTPMAHGLKTVNLYLVPTTPTFGGDAAIGGIVHNMPYHQAVSGATVTIENATWSDTTTANSAGYYFFDNLTINESYTVSSAQTGYQPSAEYTATAVNATFTQQDIGMSGIYTLTIELRDATDHSLISPSLTVEAGGATNATTAGQTTFHNLDYGVVTVTVSGNDDYYGTSENILVEEDATETIYLTRKTESTPFAYPPHNVKFIVRSAFGGPIEGVTVQATGYETTMGSWSWLFDLLGLDYEETQIHNQTMNGTTGTDGAINFMMIEAIKYRITFAKAGEIETTWEGFPKDEYYTIWASEFGAGEWFEHGSDPFAVINFTVAGTSADETSAALTVYYNDTLAETTSATAYLNQTFINGTEVNIDSHTETSDSWNHTFTIAGDHRGESYIVRLRAIHETYGNITRDYGVHYKPAPTSLGLPEDLLLFAAMGVMLFTCLFFGQTSVGAGCIIFALEGWIFFWLGWLADLGSEYAVGTVLVIITFVAFLVNVMHRSKRERFT